MKKKDDFRVTTVGILVEIGITLAFIAAGLIISFIIRG